MTDYISRQEEREAKIARYNTATSLNGGYISRQAAIWLVENGSRKWGEEYGVSDVLCDLDDMQSADVRENITAHKVIGGGEHEGATCWFECSKCGQTVDVDDVFCKRCGAQFGE